MIQFTEQAYDWDECMDKIRAKYGERFTILSRKAIRLGGFLGFFTKEGIEVSGYVSNRYEKNSSGLVTFQGSNFSGPAGGPSAVPASSSTVSGPALTGSSGVFSREGEAPFPLRDSGPRAEAGSRAEPLDFEEAKRRVLAIAGKDLTMQQVLATVQEIKEKIGQTASSSGEEHSNLKRLRECLTLNDFSAKYQEMILARVKKECSLETLEDFDALQDAVLEMIGESIRIYREKPASRRPRIMILVGPTGVGKTTTIAKLAAVYALPDPGTKPLSVRMITIDSLRIGARSQIEAYGKIMGIPVAYVDSHEELRKTVALFSEGVDLILIDTFGKSPRDAVKLGEMKHTLDACGSRAEVHLALIAATKTSDLQDILRQFEPFNYQSVVITKMDETVRIGNMISALAEKGKSVSYITNGQTVPTDIKRAEVTHFLCNLEGFQVNRQKLEARFPVDSREEIQWS
jgi:flagellar biosynthesis protein FlhF